MFRLFKPKTESFLGIDIGTARLKVVQLGKARKKIILEAYGFCDECASLDEPLKAAQILKKVLGEAKVSTKRAIMSVPVFSCFSALIEMPQMSQKEIDKAIRFEAKKYVPVSLEEVNLGWDIVGTGDKGLQVMLVAIPKELSRKYGQVAQASDLELVALETESFALIRSLTGKDKTRLIIVDLGQHATSISVVEGGNIKATRSLKANRIEHILAEIKKIIDWQRQKAKAPIKKLILTGGRVKQPKALNQLMEVPGLEVILGNPWQGISYPRRLKSTLAELAPSLAVAVGLAMREM